MHTWNVFHEEQLAKFAPHGYVITSTQKEVKMTIHQRPNFTSVLVKPALSNYM